MTMLETAGPTETVIAMPADLDISTLGRFREQLELAAADRPARLVIDFAACRYLDAQAILVLLDVHQQLWRADGRLVLRDCNPDTTRLLALAGVIDVFLLEHPRDVPKQETSA
jgi:anti-anti-sigma factor